MSKTSDGPNGDDHRYCVEILLPLAGEDGSPHPQQKFEELKARLVEAFGGLTAFTRTPAEGLWRDGRSVERDQIVVFEGMAETLEAAWWSSLRTDLESAFGQQEIVIRACRIRRL